MKYFFYAAVAALLLSATACKNNGVAGGLKDLEGKSTVDTMSYALGISIGQNFVKMELNDLNYDLFVQGIRDQLDTAGNRAFEVDEAEMFLSNEFRRRHLEKSQALKQPAEDFMKSNATQEGVQQTESGLQYKVITQGTGMTPAMGDTVLVNYVGTLRDGVEFDSNTMMGEPVDFVISPRMMRGWNEGLSLMPEGSRYILYVPWQLGAGEEGSGDIEPYSVLIFNVELVKVKKGKAAMPFPSMPK